MNLSGKKVLVIGLARTGRDCARFLVDHGALVLVTDLRSKQELEPELESLKEFSIEYRLGGEDAASVQGFDLVVPSPGVPQNNVMLQAAQRREIPIVSDMELAFRF